MASLMSTSTPTKSWVIVYYDTDTNYMYLPMTPDEISDTQQAIWSSQQIIGRSSPIAAYTGTDARQISFSMSLHREMNGSDKQQEIDKIIDLFRKALYPKYLQLGLIPPKIRIVIADIAIDGVLSNLSYTWKKPIVNNRYMLCDVSISIIGYSTKVMSYNELGSAGNPEKIGNNLV